MASKRFQLCRPGKLEMEPAYQAMWDEMKVGERVCGLPRRVWFDRLHTSEVGPVLNVAVIDREAAQRGRTICGLLRAELGDWPGMFSADRVTYVSDVWIGRAVRTAKERQALADAYKRTLVEWMRLHRSTNLWCNAVDVAQRRIWRRWGMERGVVMQGTVDSLSRRAAPDERGDV